MKRYRLSKSAILRWMFLRNLMFVGTWIVLFDILNLSKYIKPSMEFIDLIGSIYFFVAILLPFIQFFAWSYYVNDKFIEMRYGLIYRKSVCVPVEKIKYIDLTQDPIAMLLRIKIVKIYTAGGKVVIPGIGYKMATTIWNLVRTDNLEVK